MKKPLALAVATLAIVAACEGTNPITSTTPLSPSASSQSRGEVGQPELTMLGAHSIRGYAGNPNKVYGNMTSHGGAIMPSSVTYAIFWGPGWNTNSTFTADKLPGIASLLSGFGGSNYAKTSDEYTGTNGQVGTASTYMGQFVDNAAAPSAAPQVSAVQAEVCKVLSANGVTPRSDAVYNVYATTTRGGAGYCAWHSYGSCNGVNVQFAWYFNLDGDSGCNPGTPYGSYTSGHTNSQGLAAIANVTAHEVYETITDPRNGGWYDAGNGENADKCAWSFSPNNSGLVTLSNASTWKLQMEWSNAAFTAGTGYANRHAQNACLDGIVKF